MIIDYSELTTEIANFYKLYLAAMIVWTRKQSWVEGYNPEHLRDLNKMRHIRKEFVRKYSRKTQDTINPLIHESVHESKLQQQKKHINHAFFIHIWKTVLSAIPSQMLQKMNQAQELVSYKQDT